MAIECDVLVVGAGPAGSSAARAAAKKGLNVICVEKAESIASNVQCAESISNYLLEHLPFPIPQTQILLSLKGIRFSTSDVSILRTGEYWRGYAISRERFDNWLANEARRDGVNLMTGFELIDLEKEGKNVTSAYAISKNGQEVEIKPQIVIGADGVNSKVLQLIGKHHNYGDVGEVVAYDLEGIQLESIDFDQVYFGDYAPGAYAYIFPKSFSKCGVGVATIYSKRDLNRYYKKFSSIPSINSQISNPKKKLKRSGYVPINYTCKRWVYGNIMFVGDAANQTIKPFIEGILPSIICGDISGKISAENLIQNNSLNDYPKVVKSKIGCYIERSDKITELMHEISLDVDSPLSHLLNLALFSDLLSIEEITDSIDEDYKKVLAKIKKLI